MSSWRDTYAALVSAADIASLTRLIHELEDRTCERQRELAENPDPAESREIWFALRHILSIKVERLGWPDPRKNESTEAL